MMQHSVDYSEFSQGFHSVHKRPFRSAVFIPQFAYSDSQLRQAIAAQVYRYCYIDRRGTLADFLAMSLDELRTECDRAEKKMRSAQLNMAGHLRDCYATGNYVDMISRVVWGSWRMGEKSTEVAAQVGISPVKVRKLLLAVADCGRALGFDVTEKRHHSSKARPVVLALREPQYKGRQLARLRHLTGVRKRSQDPRWRANTTRAARERSQDPAWRAANSAAVRQTVRSRRWRAALRAGIERRSLNPGWRERSAEANRLRLAAGKATEMAHNRWHVRRGKANPNCPLCQ